MKYILLVLNVFLSASAFAWDFEVDGYCYNKLTDTTCALALPTGKGSLSYYTGNVVIPDSVSYRGVEYTVTTIASCALSRSATSGSSITYNDELLSVVLPSSLEYINENAFRGCRKLTSIVIPSGVKKVGYTAFEGCSKITEVTLEEGSEPISFSCGNTNYRGVFSSCPLKKVFIGRNIELELYYSSYDSFCLSNGPFSWKSNLTDITISDNVTSIPQYLFYTNSGMTNIILGNNIKSIGEGAFRNCTNLSSVIIGNSLETIGYQAFKSTSNDLKIYLFSNNLNKIGSEVCPNQTNFYVLNKELYSTLLANYSLTNMFDVEPSNTVYSGKPCNIRIDNNTDFELSNVQEFIDCGTYTNLNANLLVFDRTMNISIPCDVTITPASATLIANDFIRKYGNSNPEFTYSVFGLKNGETTSVIQVQPTIQTTAQESSVPGSYPIIPFGAEAQNYIFNYERGTLTITKADQIIEWEQEFGMVNVGDVIELKATSSAGLPIKYTATDETVAEIFAQGGKKYVEFLKPGNVLLRATQEGNENYNEADRVSKSVKVGLLVSAITLNQDFATIEVGSSLQLTAIVTPIGASNKTLTWESANAEIATVDTNGKVNALKQGSTIITVKTTDGSNLSASCTLTVVQLISSIYISESRVRMRLGEQKTIIAYALPTDATNPNLRWYSENESVATVEDGTITAVGIGSTNICVESTDGSNIVEKCEIEIGEASGIDSISSNDIRVYVSNGLINIANIPANQTAQLFLTNGTLVESEISTGNIMSFQPSANGIYIVVVGTQRYKVVIR